MTSPASFSGAARLADDTRRRFLSTIVAHVPLARLVEVHLFPPMRQGGVETGVAIVAATTEKPETAESGTAESPTAVSDTAADTAEADAAEADAACDPTEDAAVSEPAAPDSAFVDSAVVAPAVPDAAPPFRHTVFTARYRVTIKGPDRGKWDADVVEEADAPLVTVEAVVRGVQRRAGDTAAPDRIGPDVVARILGVPNAPNATPAP